MRAEISVRASAPLSICIVGDGAVGKTALLTRYMSDEFTETYEPTIFEDWSGDAEVDGHSVNIVLRDTAGQEAFDAINVNSYIGVDCFVLCFSRAIPIRLHRFE